jgi:hypothetical protein
MGLDMFIHRKIYGYKTKNDTISPKIEDYSKLESGRTNRVELSEEICYWRKANHIHNWFVENCQDGKDECQEQFLTLDKIRELRKTCMSVLQILHGHEIRVPKKFVMEYKASRQKFNRVNTVQRILFDIDNLKEMKKLICGFHMVNKFLVSKIKKILPRKDGFFFGDTKYDGWYIDDIIDTIEMIDKLLDEDVELRKKGFYPEYYYQSSW